MPAACRQSTEQRGLRSLVIKMKRLRIELGSEGLDLVLIDSMRSAHKSLSHVKVLQVKAAISTRISSKSHRTSVQCLGSALNGKLCFDACRTLRPWLMPTSQAKDMLHVSRRSI